MGVTLIMNWNQLAVQGMQCWDQVAFYVLTIHFSGQSEQSKQNTPDPGDF